MSDVTLLLIEYTMAMAVCDRKKGRRGGMRGREQMRDGGREKEKEKRNEERSVFSKRERES